MLIKEIELNNFRIYKGVNKINLTPDGDKNIIIVSGNNGFGKTTFLMALVWCLYGRQMDKVDDLYRKEIEEKGGYSKYIGGSLNYDAKKGGATKFSVSITFTDVVIPDTPCTEITISRSYDSATDIDDELEILIDGKKNDLFTGSRKEITEEEEIFIRDYILPIEIAKFFFFDAEKIVSFAQINTPEQRRDLSRAYSQVLGIQKYEDLRKELERIKDEYRKESAKPEDKKEFNDLLNNIDYGENKIQELNEDIKQLDEDVLQQKHDSKELQEKLIREGDTMTMDELNSYRERRDEKNKEMREAEDGLKEMYNLIPFGLAGGLMTQVNDQIKAEKDFALNQNQIEGIQEKTDDILQDIENSKQNLGFAIDIKVRDFYEGQIRELIKKHFYNEIDESRFEHFAPIHGFTDVQRQEFSNLISKIQGCKAKFESLFNSYEKAKSEQYSIERRIREAEKKAESDYVQSLRQRKESIDRKVEELSQQIGAKKQEIIEVSARITADKKRKEDLSKKISVSKQNKAVDDEATKLVRTISNFLNRFKEEKKKALAKKMEDKLSKLLHKSSLVKKVVVDINGDDVDISLYNSDDTRIDNGDLSMGERQMFASALLGALVDETDIDFPVFIDSPMQKFDASHTKNVLTEFYPYVSKQVVLFPLLLKELTEKEYNLISNRVSRTYLIDNNDISSRFVEIKTEELFSEYNRMNHAN